MQAELRVSLRLASVSFALIGLWLAVLVPLHPNILEGRLADAVLDDALWRFSHTVMFFVGIASVVVAAAMTAQYGAKERRLSTAVLVLAVVAGFATSGAGLLEATIFPLVAKQAPDVIAFDGPLFTSMLFRSLTGAWLLFPLAMGALGVLAYRAGADRTASGALAITSVSFFALGMWFVPVVGLLSCLAFGGVSLWWAAILWRLKPAGAADPSRSPDARGEMSPP